MPRRRRRTVIVLIGLAILLAAGSALAYVGWASLVGAAQPNGGPRIARPYRPVPVVGWIVTAVGQRAGVIPTKIIGGICNPHPGTPGLSPLPPGGSPLHPDGAAIAQHTGPSTATAAFYTPLAQPPAPYYYAVQRAVVRYTSGGHDIMVATCLPTAKLGDYAVSLGQTEVQLRPWQRAYIDRFGASQGRPPGPLITYNTVSFTDGPVIVTVASDLPAADVLAFARNVVVR